MVVRDVNTQISQFIIQFSNDVQQPRNKNVIKQDTKLLKDIEFIVNKNLNKLDQETIYVNVRMLSSLLELNEAKLNESRTNPKFKPILTQQEQKALTQIFHSLYNKLEKKSAPHSAQPTQSSHESKAPAAPRTPPPITTTVKEPEKTFEGEPEGLTEVTAPKVREYVEKNGLDKALEYLKNLKASIMSVVTHISSIDTLRTSIADLRAEITKNNASIESNQQKLTKLNETEGSVTFTHKTGQTLTIYSKEDFEAENQNRTKNPIPPAYRKDIMMENLTNQIKAKKAKNEKSFQEIEKNQRKLQELEAQKNNEMNEQELRQVLVKKQRNANNLERHLKLLETSSTESKTSKGAEHTKLPYEELPGAIQAAARTNPNALYDEIF